MKRKIMLVTLGVFAMLVIGTVAIGQAVPGSTTFFGGIVATGPVAMGGGLSVLGGSTANNDFSNSTGAFKTSTGVVTLGGGSSRTDVMTDINVAAALSAATMGGYSKPRPHTVNGMAAYLSAIIDGGYIPVAGGGANVWIVTDGTNTCECDQPCTLIGQGVNSENWPCYSDGGTGCVFGVPDGGLFSDGGAGAPGLGGINVQLKTLVCSHTAKNVQVLGNLQ